MRLHLGLLASVALVFSSAIPSGAWAVPVELGEAPGSTLALTLKAIRGAKSDLRINIYELSSPEIVQAIVARVEAGVHVDLLLEGQPVGGMGRAERAAMAQITQAMRDANARRRSGEAFDHFYLMTGKERFEPQQAVDPVQGAQSQNIAKRRFRFDHAKYVLADCARLLIGSENYSPTGAPRPGAPGNRGWVTLIHDARTGEEFNAVFEHDTDLSYGDVREVAIDDLSSRKFSHARACAAKSSARKRRAGALDARSITPIFSPTTSLDGLVGLLRSARHSIEVEQMNLDAEWKKERSPLVDELIAAARRGVTVRVLLNDDAAFSHPGGAPRPSKNLRTVGLLNQAARAENLRLEARVADLKAMGVTYIHNKGLLVDGDKTLVSSINWVWNSVMNNREAAVVLEGEEIFAHYGGLFERDWAVSAR